MSTLSALSWNPGLEVGNAIIDADHEETVTLLAEVAGMDAAAFPAGFARFADHLREHLTREEGLMQQYGFPAYPIHKHEHDRVRRELEGIEKRLAAGNMMLARGYVTDIVPDWFINHKNTMDSATAAWIRQHGG